MMIILLAGSLSYSTWMLLLLPGASIRVGQKNNNKHFLCKQRALQQQQQQLVVVVAVMILEGCRMSRQYITDVSCRSRRK